MIVDIDSWHMRRCRANYGWDYTPRDLCRHFWRTIWAVVKPLVLIALALGWLALMGWLIWSMLHNPWLLLGFAGGGVAGLLILAANHLLSGHGRPAKPKREKAPGLLSSWLKAKKGRYCPIIEVRREVGK